MDDIWSLEAWDKVKLFFPDNNNRSRIIITTRLSNVALHFSGDNGDVDIEMNFLNKDVNWNLLCKIVFREEGCPLELERIGKKIATNCNGLPLSIVVIGGLLAKSKQTREYWEYIAKNLNSVVNLKDNERCLKLLYTSYNHLSVHLKPCFLYMGVFLEDYKIDVSNLISLWVAKGFLKPISGKILEEAANEYIKDFIDRNLILVNKRGPTGKVKFIDIHDLLRDLCFRETQNDKFLHVTMQHSLNNPQGINTQRCISIHPKSSEKEDRFLDALQSTSLTRSLKCDSPKVLGCPKFILLRVLKTYTKNPLQMTFLGRFNMRYLAFSEPIPHEKFSRVRVDHSRLLSSMQGFWNLQTLILGEFTLSTCNVDILKMPLLRPVKTKFCLRLQDHSNGFSSRCLGRQDDVVLENL